jgi:hypothetical protein
MVTIRPATITDEPRAMELLAQLIEDGAPRPDLWGPTFRELLGSERGAALVAEDENGVLGLITFSYNLAIRYGGEYAQIEELIVDPRARGLERGRSPRSSLYRGGPRPWLPGNWSLLARAHTGVLREARFQLHRPRTSPTPLTLTSDPRDANLVADTSSPSHNLESRLRLIWVIWTLQTGP